MPGDAMLGGHGELGRYGEAIPGPPWILGHRGTPHEAPENTLASLRRALDVGLDGVEYDLRACGSGELVLLHDARLERTTDGRGALIARTLPELAGLDAGSWFGRSFRGEPLPLFDEALDLVGDPERGQPLHMIELKERGLVSLVARTLEELGTERPVRVASFLRDVVLEARDLGLPTMLLAERASEADRALVRRERLAAYGVGPGGWRTAAGAEEWPCERWSWSLDDPDELVEACRAPLFGFNTNEPYRALATRAWVRLCPDDRGPYPLRSPVLDVEPENLDAATRERGEWYGSWTVAAEVRNPFPVSVEIAAGVFVLSGAFEVEGLPWRGRLAAGATARIPFRIVGGSRRPGRDPLFAVQYRWSAGPALQRGVRGGHLLLDAPLPRVRTAVADGVTRRLELLREDPFDPPASLALRRSGVHLLVELENPGALAHPHVVAHLDGRTVRGGRGLRLALPPDFDARPGGVPFSCGVEGRLGEHAALRRWAGGVPEGLENGVPGRLVPLVHA